MSTTLHGSGYYYSRLPPSSLRSGPLFFYIRPRASFAPRSWATNLTRYFPSFRTSKQDLTSYSRRDHDRPANPTHSIKSPIHVYSSSPMRIRPSEASP